MADAAVYIGHAHAFTSETRIRHLRPHFLSTTTIWNHDPTVAMWRLAFDVARLIVDRGQACQAVRAAGLSSCSRLRLFRPMCTPPRPPFTAISMGVGPGQGPESALGPTSTPCCVFGFAHSLTASRQSGPDSGDWPVAVYAYLQVWAYTGLSGDAPLGDGQGSRLFL